MTVSGGGGGNWLYWLYWLADYLDVDDRQILVAEVDDRVEVLHPGGEECAEGAPQPRTLRLPVTSEVGAAHPVHVPGRRLVQRRHTQLYIYTQTHTHTHTPFIYDKNIEIENAKHNIFYHTLFVLYKMIRI